MSQIVTIDGIAGMISSQDNVLATAYAGTGAAITYYGTGGISVISFNNGVNDTSGGSYNWTVYEALISFDLSSLAHLKGKLTGASLSFASPSGAYNLVTDFLLEFREYDFGSPSSADWVAPGDISALDPIIFQFDSADYDPSTREYMTQIYPEALQAISDNLGGTFRMLGSSDDIRLQTPLAADSWFGFWNDRSGSSSNWPRLTLTYADVAVAGVNQ